MMLSSWVMNLIWNSFAACPRNTSVTMRPSAMRTMCCFRHPPLLRVCGPGSRLDEEFHLNPGQLDDVVIVQSVGLGVQGLAVQHGKARTLDVGDEEPLRAARDDRHLHSRLAERRERLGQVELLARV